MSPGTPNCAHQNVWNDSPIRAAHDDNYDYREFAERLASFIASTPKGFGSTVFGLAGPWGSGKTSVANLVEEVLSGPNHSGWSVTWFSPWATSDLEAMLLEFAQTIAAAGPGGAKQDLVARLKELVRKGSRAASIIPGQLGEAAEVVHSLADRVEDKNWSAVINGLQKEVERLNRRILVVVDDLDRLDADELAVVLKIVRVLGRVADVHYLLLYDQKALYETLEIADARAGVSWPGEYLEKFVQHVFRMPPLTRFRIGAEIESWLEASKLNIQSRDFSRDPVQEPILRLLNTPRKLRRFLTRLDFYCGTRNLNEIRVEDLFLLTVLETAAPSVFEELWTHKMELITGNANHAWRYNGRGGKHPMVASQLTKSLDEDSAAAVQQLIVQLFPNTNLTEETASVSISPADRSIADPDYFDRYFVGGVPSGDVADGEVFSAVQFAAEGNGRALKELFNRSNRVLDLTVVKGSQITLGEDRAKLALIGILMDYLAEIPFKSFAFYDPTSGLFKWIVDLMSELDPSTSNVTNINRHLENLPFDYELRLGTYVQHYLARGSLDSWLQVLARRRFEHLLGLLGGKDPEPTVVPYFQHMMFIKQAGLQKELAVEAERSLGETESSVIRLPALFIDVDNFAISGGWTDVAIFRRELMVEFVSLLNLNSETEKRILAFKDFEGGYFELPGRREPVDWVGLTSNLKRNLGA